MGDGSSGSSGAGLTKTPPWQAVLERGERVALDLVFDGVGMWAPIAAVVSRSYRQGPVLKAIVQMLRQVFADEA